MIAGPFRSRPSPWFGEKPIREELFGLERLQDHARSLAWAQASDTVPRRGVSLNARLADNEARLRQTYRATRLALQVAMQGRGRVEGVRCRLLPLAQQLPVRRAHCPVHSALPPQCEWLW